MTNLYAIETIDLTKEYLPPGRLTSLIMKSPIKAPIIAVEGVSLQIKQGELFGMIGPNGAGKTTFTKMLCTLLSPTSGTASINGYDVVRSESEVKASIGFVSSEERSFYWRLTARQNLRFFASLGNLQAPEADKRIDEVLELLSLKDAADNLVYSFSSGMKQKLAIARGLLADPQVLFMDEPTRSIDPLSAREIKRFVKNDLVGAQGKTVFLTSHRLEEIEELCNRFAILRQGKVTFCGTLADLQASLRPDEHYLICIKGLSQKDVVSFFARNSFGQASIDFVEETGIASVGLSLMNAGSDLPKLISGVTAMGATVLSFERQEFKLEDMFIEHLTRCVAQ